MRTPWCAVMLLSLCLFLSGPLVCAQEGAAPQPELKTDVPPDTLSIGNSDDEPEEAAPAPQPATPSSPSSASKSSSEKNPTTPSEENSAQKDSAPSSPSSVENPGQASPESNIEESELTPEENLKAPAPEPTPSDESQNASPSASPAEEAATLDVEDESSSEEPEAEAKDGLKKICDCHFSSQVSYRERRTRLGALFGIQVGSYEPVNYQPDFNTNSFDSYYAKKGPNIELMGAAKYNFFLGSIGPIFSAGLYQASSNDGDTLMLIPVTLGITYALDNLFNEPYVVPYVTGGMYSVIYQETQSGLSVKGNSAFSEFFSLGLRFQMDALDPDSHETGYEDFGIENTFLFVEARQFLPADNPLPDFSTPLQISGGLMVEF